jgi:mRNA-degrading endonuclease toxin of MazEF toxin-antitoxin module
LVISLTQMNNAPAALAIGVPLTTTDWSSQLHVRIDPAESGLLRVNYAMPEMIRSISTLRMGEQVGRVPKAAVETAVANTGFLHGLGRIRF